MLEKQSLNDSEVLNGHFTLEPEVQIKEEKEFLEVSFSGVTIKKEVEEAVEFDAVKNETFEYEDIKVEPNDYSEDTGGCSEMRFASDSDSEFRKGLRSLDIKEIKEEKRLTPDLVKKINEEARDVVRKQWSSLLHKVAVISDPSEPDSLKCRKCRLNFRAKSDLVQHLENHVDTLFRCSQCNMVFDREFSLRIHQAFHGTLRQHKCEVCEKTFTRKSTLKDHLLSHSGEKPYQCDVCKKYYRSKLSLISHFRYHSQEKKYECPVCKKLFFQPSGLSEHLTMHRNDKDYKCDICSKRFAYQSTLKRHVKSHFGTPRYPCDECDKFFRQNSSLIVHKRTKHLGLRPFKCEDCDKAYTTSWSLKLHMNSHRVLQVSNTIEIVTQQKIG